MGQVGELLGLGGDPDHHSHELRNVDSRRQCTLKHLSQIRPHMSPGPQIRLGVNNNNAAPGDGLKQQPA